MLFIRLVRYIRKYGFIRVFCSIVFDTLFKDCLFNFSKLEKVHEKGKKIFAQLSMSVTKHLGTDWRKEIILNRTDIEFNHGSEAQKMGARQ
ncbi:hypothetical protein CEXT_595191 [Caerostris extrusa]|uniref:Uncharacterized protein n=1 Tax=Caerostris extrusa TaxID=172846 RepID=A0AAV4VCI8_CAEEX|nr:hypothetical protein CEXT_595191 [Caerostris extrusa]